MATTLQTADILNPVTALGLLPLDSTRLLLAGQGPFLRVLELEAGKSYYIYRIFDAQVIHGIRTSKAFHGNHNDANFKCLIWGGRSVSIVNLTSFSGSSHKERLSLQIIVKEIVAADWILDACFPHSFEADWHRIACRHEALSLTSHNALLALHKTDEDCKELFRLTQLAAGPPSILYSAHIVWRQSHQVLAAAGTVFGEVHVWSYKLETNVACLLHTFSGHEGSVFGVRILNGVSGIDGVHTLGSCSDDRTIKLWNVYSNPELNSSRASKPSFNVLYGFRQESVKDSEERLERSLATATGHKSRIWDIHFLPSHGCFSSLISCGEDATAQIWNIEHLANSSNRSSDLAHNDAALHLDSIYEFHFGKNIWATAIHKQGNGHALISTGGADGRIVFYSVPKISKRLITDSLRGPWSIEYVRTRCNSKDMVKELQKAPPTASRQSSSVTKAIFSRLIGKWNIERTLESMISTYPSGTFRGTAHLSSRLSTDKAYDAEYVYVEEGQLTTYQGLSLRASRSYVYRFQEDTNSITAWFVKSGKDAVVDYFFHRITFDETIGEQASKKLAPYVASAHHLCVDDVYTVAYTFRLSEVLSLNDWSIRYDVKGPKKDYTTHARYTRISDESDEIINQNDCERRELQNDAFKCYAWISKNIFLVTTAQGWVLLGSLTEKPAVGNDSNSILADISEESSVIWSSVTQLAGLASYSIVSSVFEQHLALLGGPQGDIFLFLYPQMSITPIRKLPRKISYLFAQQLWELSKDVSLVRSPYVGVLATYLGSSNVHVFVLDIADRLNTDPERSGPSLQESILDLPPGFNTVCAQFIESKDILVLGSRSGAIAFYYKPTGTTAMYSRDSCGCVWQIHGEDAVTIIQELPSRIHPEARHFYLLTAGRNGKYAIQRVSVDRGKSSEQVTLETVHVSKPSFGPNIEGAWIESPDKDIILWGFRSKNFVVWNETRQTEMTTLDCGGCHRSWAYVPNDDGKGGGKLVWTQAATCNLNTQVAASHKVVQVGSHGREIKAMAAMHGMVGPSDKSITWIATGSEDTTIRIYIFDSEKCWCPEELFRSQGIINEHTTGVQQLRWSPNGQYLFSAGGCEEFFAWRIRQLPCSGIRMGIVCEARVPTMANSADLRIMDFDIMAVFDDRSIGGASSFLVSMVYSDSSIRLWHFDPTRKENLFNLLLATTYATCCLTQAQFICSQEKFLLLTAATDGYLAFWSLTSTLEDNGIVSIDSKLRSVPAMYQGPFKPMLQMQGRTHIHQNTVKCMTVVGLSDDEVLIATGGDDNAIAFTRVTYPSASTEAPNCSTLLLPRAHASTITAIQHVRIASDSAISRGKVQHRFLSTGNDQRLKSWLLTIDLDKPGVEAFSVRKEGNLHSTIADAACMVQMENSISGEGMFAVAGIGIETWKLDV